MSATTCLQGATYDLGPLVRIPLGEGLTFRVGDVLVAVFRTRDGGVYATQALCPHRAGPLADGLIGAGKVVCPLHGYKFDLATGRPVGNGCEALRTHSVQVGPSGEILLTLGTDVLAAESEDLHGQP